MYVCKCENDTTVVMLSRLPCKYDANRVMLCLGVCKYHISSVMSLNSDWRFRMTVSASCKYPISTLELAPINTASSSTSVTYLFCALIANGSRKITCR